MSQWQVKPIPKSVAEKIIKAKHYSQKIGIFWEGFGLFKDDKIVGVCCFGQPSPAVQKHAFKDRNFPLYELTRLVVDDDQEKNAGSFLIGNALRMLKNKPCAVVSYADSAHGHCGIVYQATNWIYTGATVSHDKLYLVDGELLHPTTIRDRFKTTSIAAWAKENGIQTVAPKQKHRYFFLCGDKRSTKNMLAKLSYPQIKPYPKCEKSLYNSKNPCSQYI